MTDDILAQLDSDRGGGWTPTFPVVRDQQRQLRDRLRRGFDSPPELIRWQHAVAALSAGSIDAGWHTKFVTDRWALAALMSNGVDRTEYTPYAPSNTEARGYREELIERDIQPAFHRGRKRFRNQAADHTENGGIDRPEQQRFLGLRPRLHQLAAAQHDVLSDALAVDSPAISTRSGRNDWIDKVDYATAGFIADDFGERVSAYHSPWRLALAQPGATLWLKLAREVLPTMNTALSDAIEHGQEAVEIRTVDARGGIS